MSKVMNINADRFEEEVLKASTPILVDFWAPWCAPCQMMGPVLDTIAEEMGDKVKIVKVNIDEEANGALAQQYRIMSIPNMKIFKGGAIVDEIIGLQSKAGLTSSIDRHI